MSQAFIELALFASKSLILVIFILIIFIAFFALLMKSKEKIKGRLIIKNLNKKYQENTEALMVETLPKKQFKKYLKNKKNEDKINEKSAKKIKNIFVLNFHGDLKASAVADLREEITAILNVATSTDEVVVRLESPGGTVPGYGLAAAQLMRLRAKQIPLTITIDKMAASGGYMMACVANKILCAPFAIVGSIGVIVQLPNFHRLLKNKHIDFEQHTAGEYKRTVTVFGENTDAGRAKLHEEIEDIHQQFKQLILTYRQQIDIQKIATGEHWLGQHALSLQLVDIIQTSDDYLLECSKNAKLFEISYEMKKPWLSKLTTSARMFLEQTWYAST
ncbi:MAG: protease SohB [Gammaproteobacteria bacterium RIFCSPHIGHO2_12_FULL_37_14]|nr:MAG: protease SohB [Gammaproteobacteria bacterium RIFCSPHIGHO2_12_FULL_37_14]